MKEKLRWLLILALGIFLGLFVPNVFSTYSDIDPIQRAEKVAGFYIPDRFPVLQFHYKNTGSPYLKSHGEEFSGMIEILNPVDRADFRNLAKERGYLPLPYSGTDSLLINVVTPCMYSNKVFYAEQKGKLGYYKIEVLEREKKVVYFDEACGIFYFYYELDEVK